MWRYPVNRLKNANRPRGRGIYCWYGEGNDNIKRSSEKMQYAVLIVMLAVQQKIVIQCGNSR